MAYKIIKEFPNDIIYKKGETCVSLYQETHRHSPDNAADIIVFKNLLKKVEEDLKDKNGDRESILKQLSELRDDKMFWLNTLDGLAVLVNKSECLVYLLEMKLENQVIVSDKFHIKPLIKYFQANQKYQVLGINRNSIKVFEGDKFGIKETEISKEIPKTIEEALGEEIVSKATVSRSGGSSGTAFHGTGGRKDEIDKDTEKFFRVVDKAVTENISKNSKLPLILVSLDEYQTEFKKISNNPYLVKEGLKVSLESFSPSVMKDKIWEIIDRENQEKVSKNIEEFNNGLSTISSTDNLERIAKAAVENRIKTIMVEQNRVIQGALDSESGEILLDKENSDLLESLVSHVMAGGGEIVVLPKDKMPSDTGAAAIFRY